MKQTVGRIKVMVVREGTAPVCANPAEIARMLLAQAECDGREHFKAVFLDARHAVLGVYTVSIGCLTSSLVHAREVFRAAIVAGAAGIVLSHNHPSGDPEPSAEDIALTRRLMAAGTLIGIEVLDHVVTGDHAAKWVSFKERGMM
jgi:DNA repair protein RadC